MIRAELPGHVSDVHDSFPWNQPCAKAEQQLLFILLLLLGRVVLLGRAHEEGRELLHKRVPLLSGAVLARDVEREEDDGSHCERELSKNLVSFI